MPLFSLAPIPGALNKVLPPASTMDLFLVGGGGGYGEILKAVVAVEVVLTFI